MACALKYFGRSVAAAKKCGVRDRCQDRANTFSLPGLPNFGWTRLQGAPWLTGGGELMERILSGYPPSAVRNSR